MPQSWRRAFAIGIASSLVLMGCTAEIDTSPAAGSAGDGSGGTGGQPAEVPLDPQTGLPQNCDPNQELAAPAPLLRLTNREYQNSVRDLFPELSLPAAELPADNLDEGFDTLASAQALSPTLIEAYDKHAAAVAGAVSSQLARVLPCSQNGAAQEARCATEFLGKLLGRAYRRPPAADELARAQQLFDSARTSWGFAKAVELSVRGVLKTPQFLYRLETGTSDPERSSSLSLTGHEVASRLSYLFWDSMPDAELTRAAGAGELDTEAGIEQQAQRLLDDPRTRTALSTFHAQWLRFEKMRDLKKSSADYPKFREATAASLRASAEQYVSYLFWQRGDFRSFFTDTQAFVNDDLAWIYGLPPSGSATLALKEIDKTQRAGILTLAGLLAGFAHETSDAPVLRGVFVLDRLLCDSPPPPPKGVPPLQTEPGGGAPMTTREILEKTHVNSACVSCHDAIDGVGFGFGHYDAVGAYRTTERGQPVNASSELKGTLDADGKFTG
ncbi:MAG TPA: DUF1592 domain-containing protein, partial [Polyangiaceae bacterium]|nr:DUF1592 domain-containing protein [Polyangiaceae bacterium]